VQLKELGQKNPITSLGIEPATFGFYHSASTNYATREKNVAFIFKVEECSMEDINRRILQNFCTYLPKYRMSHRRRQSSLPLIILCRIKLSNALSVSLL
jgi:hypothetical protein